jgi:NAD(P)-dependent dehydrogenase (short-subunit alcohol dehydrogenase family)
VRATNLKEETTVTESTKPVALVTGAGPGLGASLVRQFAEQYAVAINARNASYVKEMLSCGRGVMLFTGATAGVKAGPRSVAFGPAKFAMRGLSQSLARELGPKGIHVAWINIDGGIGSANEALLDPDAIAETYWLWVLKTRCRVRSLTFPRLGAGAADHEDALVGHALSGAVEPQVSTCAGAGEPGPATAAGRPATPREASHAQPGGSRVLGRAGAGVARVADSVDHRAARRR